MGLNIFCFAVIIILIIIKIIKEYVIKQNIYKGKISNIDDKIDRFINENYKKIFLVFIILIFFTRIYKFGEFPTYIGVDEAGAAYDAYCLANYGVDRYLNSFPLYLINFGGGQSALYAYSTIPFIKLFGANIVSYRLPELIFFLMGILVCYLLVNNVKDKKTALLYTFLIIICPWNIDASRKGLDCNLLAPMFMLDILLLLSAKKNWQYVVAGISIGITLYAYSLSWMLLPAFLLFYIAYMLYLKKINFKQIVLLGIPIFIFALPLMYMILLNKGYATRANFGIFTIPKLPQFRVGEIQISNIWESGLYSLKTIFLERYGRYPLYYIEIPLIIIGFIIGIKKFVKSIQTKEFDFDAFITIVTIILLIVNLTVVINTTNQANIVYLPILYIATMGMLSLSKKSYIITSTVLILLTISFIDFETQYLNLYKEYELFESSYFDDNKIMNVTEKVNSYYNSEDAKKYIISEQKVQPYIYTLLQNMPSPYEFDKTKSETPYTVKSYGEYYFILPDDFENIIKETYGTQKYIFAIDNRKIEIIEYLRNLGFSEVEENSYYIMKNY